ncbi:response regulator transcription factor [Bacillus sp. FSL W7-1360]
MNRILIVDDDAHTRQLLSQYLGEAGYATDDACNGAYALQLLEARDYALVVLDVMMPEMDGYELMRQMRGQFDLPVLMLTAKSELSDKEKGYQLGIDDYLVKPFELKELLFRIQALLRRSGQGGDKVIKLRGFVINQMNYEVQVNGKTLLLPLKEFDLLYILAANAGRTLTREQLIHHVWGSGYDGSDRTVDVHVKRLRERFAPMTDDFSIKTVRGIGYMLEVQS